MSEPSKSIHKIPGQDLVPLRALAAESTGALKPEDSVQTAGERMRAEDSPTWPVIDGRKLIGSVNDKHADFKMAGHGHDPKSWKVGSIMARDSVFCYEDENCREAEAKMRAHGLTVLPVVDRQMRIVSLFRLEDVQDGTVEH